MTALRNLCIAALVFSVLTASSGTETCDSGDKFCPNVQPIEPFQDCKTRGYWYMYASTPTTVTGKRCNFFETVYPCGCIRGRMMKGVALNFVQNLETGVGIIDALKVDFVKTCNNLGIFNFTYAEGGILSHTVASLGSDSGQSYWLFSVCISPKIFKTRNSDPIIWFFSRTPVATEESIAAVKLILEKNNLSYNILERVNHTSCNYFN